ncbi:thiamine pyrophosphate enzyme, N-terminal TPP binding domain-containing protein [Melanogaster broomeanus]|nr:thiamine pyrophosphate enzyme, N-terminal TPP binding domain-containing protein [Melanogaster broomeanus]
MVLTTSSLFLHTLAQVGITHVFVNWGSDHPAMLEELERQRETNGGHALTIVTSPNEMVALSAAHGYAQATGKPAAVVVHVDVGTQALAGAVHNADRGRVPILIYAGASPFTSDGELKDVHDQPAIVRQYMRHTAQISSPANLPHVVRRALQIATSEPKGPVYLWGRREVMEQEIDQSLLERPITLAKWPSVEPTALSSTGTHTPLLKSADVILVIDAEVAWMPMNKDKDGAHERPSETAQVFIIDSGDPLKRGIGMHHEEADLVCQADAAVALAQIHGAVADVVTLAPHERAERIRKMHESWMAQLRDAESVPLLLSSSGGPAPYTTPQIVGALRTAIQASGVSREGALVLNESISSYPLVWSHMQPEIPGEVISSGGSSLGWALGGGIGAVLGGRVAKKGTGTGYDLVASIVGDGTFLFCVPASAFWMARRYQTPFLTIVLNNGGWKSPKLSMLGVHPQGHGSQCYSGCCLWWMGMGTQNKCRPRRGQKECAKELLEETIRRR